MNRLSKLRAENSSNEAQTNRRSGSLDSGLGVELGSSRATTPDRVNVTPNGNMRENNPPENVTSENVNRNEGRTSGNSASRYRISLRQLGFGIAQQNMIDSVLEHQIAVNNEQGIRSGQNTNLRLNKDNLMNALLVTPPHYTFDEMSESEKLQFIGKVRSHRSVSPRTKRMRRSVSIEIASPQNNGSMIVYASETPPHRSFDDMTDEEKRRFIGEIQERDDSFSSAGLDIATVSIENGATASRCISFASAIRDLASGTENIMDSRGGQGPGPEESASSSGIAARAVLREFQVIHGGTQNDNSVVVESSDQQETMELSGADSAVNDNNNINGHSHQEQPSECPITVATSENDTNTEEPDQAVESEVNGGLNNTVENRTEESSEAEVNSAASSNKRNALGETPKRASSRLRKQSESRAEIGKPKSSRNSGQHTPSNKHTTPAKRSAIGKRTPPAKRAPPAKRTPSTRRTPSAKRTPPEIRNAVIDEKHLSMKLRSFNNLRRSTRVRKLPSRFSDEIVKKTGKKPSPAKKRSPKQRA